MSQSETFIKMADKLPKSSIDLRKVRRELTKQESLEEDDMIIDEETHENQRLHEMIRKENLDFQTNKGISHLDIF